MTRHCWLWLTFKSVGSVVVIGLVTKEKFTSLNLPPPTLPGYDHYIIFTCELVVFL